ncbi:MAG: amidohydrolase [Alphaproteobacteria bacterium]|nr:MAG: amidohydrolase [Alphaproteobacteria bacterium]
MSVIDAHFHIWRQADLPWLSGPMQPRIFGPYEPIRRDYPMAEYLADIAQSGVTRAVYVQANWPADRGYEEAAWVASVAAETGWPHGIVAFADMTAADVRPALDRLAGLALVRGIRQQFHWHRNPLYRFAAQPELCRDPLVQRNIARLADYGLAFDLQVFAPQMAGAAELAAACPGVTFVLQHVGMPEDLSAEGLARWEEGLALLAACPNVVVKLSGLGTFIHRNDADHITRIAAVALRLFGAERCLWGSNFPIEKLWCGYGDLLAAWRAALSALPEAARRAIFHDTAARVYRV